MKNIQKSVVVVAIVIVVTVIVFYRYAANIFQAPRPEESMPVSTSQTSKIERDSENLRTLSVETSYEVPGDKVDQVLFLMTVDKSGVITEISELDAKTKIADEKQVEFSIEITKVLKGKKLSELAPVDRIGKSSLTTKAFNSVIPEFQKSL